MLRVNLDDFPTAQNVTYLNSASIALMPRPAIEAMVEFQRKVASGGTISFDEDAETQALEGARGEAANLLGADRDEIAILSSATEGICSAALSLDISGGTNVVSSDADFPSVVYPWMRLGKQKHVEVRLARNRDGIVSEHDLEKLVDDHTVAISISHVEYGTGQRFDLRWLSEIAHSHGSLLVIDATQSAGLFPVDVHPDEIDVLVAGGYKGLLGPFGAAIFYLRRELVERLTPVVAGWRSTKVPYDLDATELTFADGAKKFEASTMSYSAPVGLKESMQYLKRLGHREVTDHVRLLADRLIQAVNDSKRLSDARTLSPSNPNARSSIVSIRFGGLNQNTVAAELVRRKIIVSQRFNGVRFSFHAYNTEKDIATAINALEDIFR